MSPSQRGILEELRESGALAIATAWAVGLTATVFGVGLALIVIIGLGRLVGAW